MRERVARLEQAVTETSNRHRPRYNRSSTIYRHYRYRRHLGCYLPHTIVVYDTARGSLTSIAALLVPDFLCAAAEDPDENVVGQID